MWQQHDLERLQKRLSYTFRSPDLLKQALTHRSAKGAHNERLEFLGDSILGFVIAARLYHLFEKGSEGHLTRLRAHLVREKTLAELANEIEVGNVLKLGGGELKSGGYRRASILSDAMEAILGAIYLDGGMESAQRVILGLYDERMKSLTLDQATKDPKTQLQEWLQSRKQELPIYDVTKTEGQEHNRTYWVSCETRDGQQKTEAKGSSRRKAEQAAAEKMLSLLLGEK
ncbi:ribonuclease III [Pleionea sp. CnH1-48]|uniref:ribonuclease III n=1 Tax=Pleionea sp. CnH1-48 TaxID=2954494 RepID=UPI002097EA26|nr:ribonuclease III [Pleionea sp. CnH1-48]MCO7225466.1 ribonuclease III [Pleionea sp. CnH1-48]